MTYQLTLQNVDARISKMSSKIDVSYVNPSEMTVSIYALTAMSSFSFSFEVFFQYEKTKVFTGKFYLGMHVHSLSCSDLNNLLK